MLQWLMNKRCAIFAVVVRLQAEESQGAMADEYSHGLGVLFFFFFQRVEDGILTILGSKEPRHFRDDFSQAVPPPS